LESGKSYIGSSLNLGRRLKLYYSDYHLNDSDNRNMIINKALIKHGHSKFSLEILEYCDPEDVIERENYYIKVFKPEYNILQEAGSSFGYKHTKETLLKMSEAKKAENHPLFGKFHSEETKILMSEAKKGHTLSEDTRMKISKTLKGKITSSETKAKMSSAIGTETEILDKETNEVTTYSSGHQAAKALGCSDWVIRTYANSKKLYKDRYIITKKFK
jgi:group I intron endonuclease